MSFVGCTLLLGAAALAQESQPSGPGTAGAPAAQKPAAKPAVADDQGDVVEAMSLVPSGPAPAALPPSLALPQAPAQDRVQLRGFWRTLGEAGLAQSPVGADPFSLPLDGLQGSAQLFVEAAVAHGSFEARASGLAGYAVYGRTAAGASSAVQRLGTARGDWEPELREAYAGWSAGPIDLRIGQQRVAWGKADADSPNDVVNARDRRDPLMERELMHLPTPLLKTDLAMGFASAEAVISPVFVPDRLDVYGTNWALTQPASPLPLRGLLNAALGGSDLSQLEQIQPLLAATRLPPRNLTQPTAGLRLSASGGGVDADAYWATGFDGTPDLSFNPKVALAMAQAGPTQLTPAVLLQVLQRLAAPLYTSTYVRRQHFGMDLGTTLGPMGLRFDGAYDNKRVFLDTNLNGFVAPALTGTASIEYQTGELGKVLLVEITGTRMTDAPPPQGLLFTRDRQVTWTAGGDFKWTFLDSLEVELRGVVGLRPESYVLHPQLGFKLPADVWLRAGAILPWGETDSLGGYFHRSRAAYVALRRAL
ncbi:MAG: DUF1302 family protein [Myxococcales bacterium]